MGEPGTSAPLPSPATNGHRSAGLDIPAAMRELSLAEKIQFLSGVDMWHLPSIPRLGIPSIRTSDGPNGVRGTRMFNGTPAACLPCGTALGATWDAELIRRGGRLQADEAVAKGVSVILGPTVNMQRSPLGGRSSESFSEDPVLSGSLAAATVSGIQSRGVAATIKHFVCNEQEHERKAQDSRVGERALREIYTMPFQIAQRMARPWAYMASYNRVNGVHASENPHLIEDILRREWGFDGVVMSDWTGTYSTVEAIKAGLDIEMPGPPFLRGGLVNNALGCGKLTVDDIDACVERILALIDKVMPLGIPSHAPETTIDTPETAAVLREIASSSMVLLKNDNGVLPFAKEKSTAVIGPNAAVARYSAGGSASLEPYYAVSPLAAITEQVSGKVDYTIGYAGYDKVPLMSDMISEMKMLVYAEPHAQSPRRKAIDELRIRNTDIYLFDYYPPLPSSHVGPWYAAFVGEFKAEATGQYIFSLTVAGTADLYLDGELLVDASTGQTHGGAFFGLGAAEVTAVAALEEGRTYTVEVRFGSAATSDVTGAGSDSTMGGGIRMGCALQLDPEAEIQKAVSIAKSVDQVVIVTGLNSDWESEGFDRKTMGLPEHADRLISEVIASNPNTAVVSQTGAPVSMPWISSAPAVVQAWYCGNETGNAIADVLFGDTNPGGKLPLTFPLRLEDTPTFLNYGSERGRTVYGEGVFIGYRFYETVKKEVLFPFGHGLSYTTFKLGSLAIDVSEPTDALRVSVQVENTGPRSGHETVQVYVSQKQPSVPRPVKELKGFRKVLLAPGESATVSVDMSLKYATSFWDEGRDAWVMERDTYTVFAGTSSADDTALQASFAVSGAKRWNGV